MTPTWKLDQECFIVRDGNGQALAYVYFEDEPGRQAEDRREHRQAAGVAEPWAITGLGFFNRNRLSITFPEKASGP
jgi:hypothetical protein